MSEYPHTLAYPPYRGQEQAERMIRDELGRAITRFPRWPKDPVHQAAIVAEEAGELVRAALQLRYEAPRGKTAAEVMVYSEAVVKEAIQTGAMALRLLTHHYAKMEDT